MRRTSKVSSKKQKKNGSTDNGTPKESPSMLGSFLRGSLRRSQSFKSVASSTDKSSVSKTRERQGRSRSYKSSPGTNSAERSRTPSKERLRDSKNSTSKDSNRLRSKSPSRARIELFMEEMRAQKHQSRSTSRGPSSSRDRQGDSSQGPAQERVRSSSNGKLKSNSTGIASGEKLRHISNERLRSTSSEGKVRRQQQQTQQEQQRGTSKERLKHFLESRAASSRNISVSSGESSKEEHSFHSRSRSVCIPKSPARKKSSLSSVFSSSSSKSAPSPKSVAQLPITYNTDASEWHDTIIRRDWDLIEQMLQTFDHKMFRETSKKQPQRKLRVLKYISGTDGSRGAEDKEQDLVSPLLQSDFKGRTALHLACMEHMPWKLLQRLFFVERQAALCVDSDGRLPLHISIISNLNKQVLDRLIRVHPAGLAMADNLQRTPMAYAILRAEHRRDKTVVVTWRHPTSKRQKDWQANQEEVWDNVKFILESLVTRRKPLSKTLERTLLFESVECLIPPSSLNPMLSVTAKILQEDETMALQFIKTLFRSHYPIPIFQKTLKICGSTMDDLVLVTVVRRGMVQHYEEGCVSINREDLGRDYSFRSELLQHYKQRQMGHESSLSEACNEWWEKLRFFIRYSSFNLTDAHRLEDNYVLHAAMAIPVTPTSLVELLVRLAPLARYEIDPSTGGLPVHLACKYWDYSGSSRSNDKSASKVLNLLLAGDFVLAWKRYKRRLPLHLSILAGKQLPFIQTLLSMDVKTANVRDPLTRLFPFQLAAMGATTLPKSFDSSTHSPKSRDGDNRQLDVIFELLRANPVAVFPVMACGSGDPKRDVGRVGQHVLNWCYIYQRGKSETGWMLNQAKTTTLRNAISNGSVPAALEKWWVKLKHLIWKVYDSKHAGRMIACMPRNDDYILHAALSNGMVPPIVVELLLELYPASVKIRVPGTDRYPIHVASGSPSYTRLPFESVISMDSALEMIVLAHPEALHLESGGRLALHIAIDSGKTWEEIRPVIQQDPRFLSVPDLCSGLFPFQQIACAETSIPTHRLIRSRTSTIKWYERSSEENGRLLRSFQLEYEQEKLSSIFELLRAKPEVLGACLAKASLNSFSESIKSSFSSGVDLAIDGVWCNPMQVGRKC